MVSLTRRLACLLVLLLGLQGGAAHAVAESAEQAREPVNVAVASNFLWTLRTLADRFRADTGYPVRISGGSTGKLFAQIQRGAPFDVFLSADEESPARLERLGQGVAGFRFPYALGRLVLWTGKPEVMGAMGPDTVGQGAFRILAMANPSLAPYGRAARQTLQSLKVLPTLEGRIVFGESVGQTFALIALGNADLGFVARSQIQSAPERLRRAAWLVPAALHEAIRQDALLLKRGLEKPGAVAFMDFLKSAPARALIGEAGYDLPATGSRPDEI
ncbi:MAG: molybdate ABC transporter substrate-binding protein [Alphaproteobacteria bacterium]